ncbi:hypothetical protein PCASD_08835 [Puccinia coronata f. sp. avenae]|uniref:Reverse transcriptase Ty1/copia-type domain-containing protein n=1 Tax=Puccinia coronata f. sp. avenae TaxID=200324 RepID=A0A2N5US97_9BASI|nr:hypothetical protein PCASD_08835 [Puccinia coronata f. sp. avenae]
MQRAGNGVQPLHAFPKGRAAAARRVYWACACPLGVRLSSPLHQASLSEQQQFRALNINYQALIGSLKYLSILTQPDISYPISKLSQYLENPGMPHFTAAMQVFRYLKGTMFWGLHFRKQDSFNLQAYIDADWANCPNTRRSRTGFMVLRNSHLISWKSAKQATVSLSSTEAKYKSLADACKDVVWIQNLSSEILTNPSATPALVHVDNRGAIDLALSQVSQNGFRTKHMDLCLQFIQDLIAQKILKISFIPSHKNSADFLTKPVGRTSIHRAISQFITDAPILAALCSQAPSMSACQDPVPGATNVADAFMHALRDELRSDKQGINCPGTALGPDHLDGQDQAK